MSHTEPDPTIGLLQASAPVHNVQNAFCSQTYPSQKSGLAETHPIIQTKTVKNNKVDFIVFLKNIF